MSLDPETASRERAMANYCLSGIEPNIPGVDPARQEVYRCLVYNSIRTTLSEVFPIACEALEDKWLGVVRDFLRDHPIASNAVWRVAHEFYQYATRKELGVELGLPYLDDLLKFEWLELEVDVMEDLPVPLFDLHGDALTDKLVLNPEYRLIHLSYPVFRMRGEKLLGSEGAYFLFIFRHPETLYSRFIELSAPFALMVEMLGQEHLSYPDLVEATLPHFPTLDRRNLLQYEKDFITMMIDKRAILGFEGSVA